MNSNNALPLTDDSDPTTTTRRFRIYDSTDPDPSATPVAHGVVFPPPTCTIQTVWQDGHLEQHGDIQTILTDYGDRLLWVDAVAGLTGPHEE